jgi:ABC-2 type transport system permease protein
VSAQLRSELLKQRSTRTVLGLFVGMIALVLLADLLHGFGLPVGDVDSVDEQLTMLFRWGEALGALFAGLLGAMSFTGEFRHGTIRPTFLAAPRRGRVVAAKMTASMLLAVGFALVAAAVTAAVGNAALSARGIDVELDAGDYALLMAGGVVAAVLWAAIGVGLGALVRNQVPALVGICAWLLFVENLLVAYVPDAGRLAPGAAAAAITGQDPDTLLAPAVGALVLVLWTAAATTAGTIATDRRDVP